VREAARAQGKIDEIEEKDFYKEFPGHEIRDEVAAVKSIERSLTNSLLKLRDHFKIFPGHPFFGNLGHTLDGIINMIRQYRRETGEKSSDKDERKLARVHELEDKARRLEIANEGLRSEVEELRGKLAATGGGGDMSISEFQAAIKKWEETVETQRGIIARLENENATLRAERERAR